MNSFFGLYFHFCLEIAQKTWAKASLIQSVKVHDLPDPLISKLSIVRGLWPANAPADQNLQYRKWCPYKWRGLVSTPIYARKVRNGPAGADQGHSTASQGSCHVHGTPCWKPPTLPPPPLPLPSRDWSTPTIKVATRAGKCIGHW